MILHILPRTLTCSRSARVDWHPGVCAGLGAPRATLVTCQLPGALEPVRAPPPRRYKSSLSPITRNLHLGLSTQQGLCEPEFTAFLHTHIFIFLSFSALAAFFRLGGMPIFFFFSCKKEKKIKSFSVIEIHDKLQILSSFLLF